MEENPPTPPSEENAPDPAPQPPIARKPRTEEPPAEPFAREELQASLTKPLRVLDVVLGERKRMVANVRSATELRHLIMVLLMCSFVFAIPFAIVDGFGRLAHVAALFLGTAMLCFPSLQVFCSYLGVKLHPAQNLAIVLLIPAAAAAFTLGFAPIYWFLDATIPEEGGLGGTPMRVGLLIAALIPALCHVNRCLFQDLRLNALRDNWPLWIGWQVLFVFLTYRMATTLGLFE